MKTQTIINYQRWASRGYLTPLTCPNHPYHDLLALQKLDGITLTCPRGDHERDLGLIEYKDIKNKAIMADYLFREANS